MRAQWRWRAHTLTALALSHQSLLAKPALLQPHLPAHPLRARRALQTLPAMSSASIDATASSPSPALSAFSPAANAGAASSSPSASASPSRTPQGGRRRPREERWRNRREPWNQPGKEGAEEKVADEGGDEGEGGEKRQRLAGGKRKMALLFAYNGSHHQGLQVQTGQTSLRTIEGDLSAAICSAGGMLQSNLERLAKVNWQRTARTDKGVHAAGNLISLNLVTEPPGVVDVSATPHSRHSHPSHPLADGCVPHLCALPCAVCCECDVGVSASTSTCLRTSACWPPSA